MTLPQEFAGIGSLFLRACMVDEDALGFQTMLEVIYQSGLREGQYTFSLYKNNESRWHPNGDVDQLDDVIISIC